MTRRLSAAEARQLLADDLGGLLADEALALVPEVSEAHASRAPESSSRLPREKSTVVNQVLPNVERLIVTAIERGDSVTPKSMGRLLQYAAWRHARDGSFDPMTDLAEARIVEYTRLGLPHVTDSTRATYLSTLRRIRRGPHTSAVKKRAAVPPYSEPEWVALGHAAQAAGGLAGDARALLALTGGAGLRSEEIAQARGSWVGSRRGHVTVTVPADASPTGRVIVVDGAEGDVLLSVAQDRGSAFLIAPERTNRRDVVTIVGKSISRRSAWWRHFNVNRARHRWLAALLARPLPYPVVCAMAGVRPGTSLTADLLAHMDAPSLTDTIEALNSASFVERTAAR